MIYIVQVINFIVFVYVCNNLRKIISDFPRDSPRIVGHERSYELEEPLDVNCTSAKSFPAPDLQWLINGEKVNILLVQYLKNS